MVNDADEMCARRDQIHCGLRSRLGVPAKLVTKGRCPCPESPEGGAERVSHQRCRLVAEGRHWTLGNYTHPAATRHPTCCAPAPRRWEPKGLVQYCGLPLGAGTAGDARATHGLRRSEAHPGPAEQVARREVEDPEDAPQVDEQASADQDDVLPAQAAYGEYNQQEKEWHEVEPVAVAELCPARCGEHEIEERYGDRGDPRCKRQPITQTNSKRYRNGDQHPERG